MQTAIQITGAARPPAYKKERAGREWRRHLRRQAPDPGTLPAFVTQRVHNAYHHLADGSLPAEQWDADTELAAIVHLLGKYSVARATKLYASAAEGYFGVQQRLGNRVPAFSATKAARKVRLVARRRLALPASYGNTDVYIALRRSLGELS